MTDRRTFLKSAAAAGSLGLAGQACSVTPKRQLTEYFGVHPFIENHPEAVFIMHTDVEKKTDSSALKETGYTLGQSLFVRKSQGEGCVPLTHKIAVKPNLTNSFTSKEHYPKQASKYPLEYGMGIITDPYFVEGIIESMKGLGISGSQFYIREVNCPWDFGPRGYIAMAERTGADIRDQNAEIGTISKDEINWVNVPDGWIHKKIPYLWPVNIRDSFLLNISKFKAHGMGITLCCKNHQGSIARHYQHFCGEFRTLKKINRKHVVRNYEEKCKAILNVIWHRVFHAGIDRQNTTTAREWISGRHEPLTTYLHHRMVSKLSKVCTVVTATVSLRVPTKGLSTITKPGIT